MVAPREAVYAATKAFVLSFAHSLRYELKDTGVTVTALQPGPTDTDFFHRAGMDNTQVGSEGKKESTRDDVARQGIDALVRRQGPRLCGVAENQDRRQAGQRRSRRVKGAMHEKMARPAQRERNNCPASRTQEENHVQIIEGSSECGSPPSEGTAGRGD